METPDPATDPQLALCQIAQRELERMNRLYSMLSHVNRAIIRTEEPQELYNATCRIAVEHGGFMLAWIGLLDPSGSGVAPVAAAGMATAVQIREIAAMTAGPSPTMEALRTGRPIIVAEIRSAPEMAAWRDIAEQWNIRSGGAFPIRLEGSIIGALNIAASEPDFFRSAEVSLLIEVADDLSFALDGMRREEKRIAAETRIRYLAHYDPQTGMPSRTLFEENLAATCQDPACKSVAVLVANLRRYHGIVQLLGPAVGQEIIRVMASRLEAALPALPVARVTESKFAVMLRSPEGLDVAEELAWKMHHALAGSIPAAGQEIFLDPFVGIAIYPRDGTPAEVLKHAMQAAAAQDMGGSCRFFFPDMDDESRRRLDLDAALRHALERGEFELHYQPQVNLSSGQIVGVEALLRWRRPGHGLMSPQHFIHMLEDSGLIVAVGEWVLHEACRRGRQWQDEGLPPLRIAVNLSARQFHGADIRTLVRRTLDATGLAPQWLELELTESIVLLDAEGVIRTLHDLNADGITQALDDFGTGYSSLSYLQRLPVSRIKLDRSFVTHITSSPHDAAIARAVVGMAHCLGLSVIAEGVETEGQLGFLHGIGCQEIQGYYFSPALADADAADLLREGRGIQPLQRNQPERLLLLVDDEPSILSALNRVLRRKGYRILTTTSAREGFDLLATHRPGVVICDQRMPEMTGTEFLRRVKELYPETVRIVLSGYTELNSVIDAVNHGAVYKFITKPWEDEALCECIEDAFRIYQLDQENRTLSHQLQAYHAHASNTATTG